MAQSIYLSTFRVWKGYLTFQEQFPAVHTVHLGRSGNPGIPSLDLQGLGKLRVEIPG